MVYKRYKGRRLRPRDKEWNKGKWVVEFMLKGNRILRAVPHARNKTEAEEEQRKIQSQIDGGFYCSTPALFSEFVDNEYLPWAEANKKSHADDRRRVKLLKNFFGNERLRNIAPYRIEKFKSSLIGVKTVRGTPRSESTINRYLALGSRILSLARINGLINTNPFSHVRKFEEGGQRERFLTYEEEGRLMEVLTGDLEFLRVPVVVSLGTGLRKSELLSLKVGEINFGQLPIFYRVNGRDLTIRPGCLLVAKSKNKETRVMPMNQEVHEALKAVVADAPAGDSVFTFSGNGVSTATIKRGFEIACTRAEITYGLTRVGGLTWHGLRHTFATRLREQGVHPFDIKELMGHKTLSVTANYAHGTPEAMRGAVNRLRGTPARVVEFRAAG